MYRTIWNAQQPMDLTTADPTAGDNAVAVPPPPTPQASAAVNVPPPAVAPPDDDVVDDGEMTWIVGDRVEVLWEDTHTWWVGTVIEVDDSDNSVRVHHDYDNEKTWYEQSE